MKVLGPTVGSAGTHLLYVVARFGGDYPLTFKREQRIANRLVADGLLVADPADRYLVSLTADGRDFLNRLMRAH